MKLASSLWCAALLGAAASFAGAQPPPAAPSGNGEVVYEYRDRDRHIEVRTQGAVSLDPSSPQVFSLGADGVLFARERRGGTVLVLRAERDQVSWRKDGKELTFDERGRSWLRRLVASRPAPPAPPPPPDGAPRRQAR